ncbi:hypothetical protein PQJ75_19880 [Rhodoplanes sp. TEM]|uniref:Uncharacterized protein n=1 Tax=Rhodoplanes tepidamans TaxID=200616 RepID=A0ABT5JB29_RHOTP|nr:MULTISPECIES: hypothetical protein [Rhodoplanes]MDC7786806.1 hypothetical protein [Rhodoplanes tepidamans]MDC7985994.1 hypothetical protein [Rhodoplanes sp. TEM]MDQ0355933.1 hypothetical protein [Rhodoplanes tepidamans]
MVALIVLIVGLFAFLIFQGTNLYWSLQVRGWIDDIARAFDLDEYLAQAIFLVVVAAATTLTTLCFSFSPLKRRLGRLGLLGLSVGVSLLLAYAWRMNFFTPEGTATRCYVLTRDPAEPVRYGNRPGTIDQQTGRPCRPVTAERLRQLQDYKNGRRPVRLTMRDPEFFDPLTGEAIVWYIRTREGTIELFDLMGFHPDGQELQPVDRDVPLAWRAQFDRQPPRRLDNPTEGDFFDSMTGKPRLWYARAAGGGFVFYDRAGFSPETGEALNPVDLDVQKEWRAHKQQADSSRCYVITRDTANVVKYWNRPGEIEPQTGRLCRLLTAEVVERLEEYKKGNRPRRIQSPDPMFFDLRTGEPIVWYFKDEKGHIELFDLMGFHPQTGEELTPITKDIARDWQSQQSSVPKVPNRITFSSNVILFDPLTGQPRLWFWRKAEADYEFFDGPGFHPRNGDALKQFTRDEARAYESEIAAKKEALLRQQEQIDRERREREERDAAARRELERKKEQERREREEQATRASEAERMCDSLAANPNDRNKVGEGVGFGVLKGQATEAIQYCEIAMRQNPQQLRFKYQLARALQWTDRPRALQLHQELTSRRYPASFDNLGWMYYMDRKDPVQAVAMFRTGAQLNDADSMVSLAEMVDRGHVVPGSPAETKIELCRRAAELGHSGASLCYQQEVAKEEQATKAREVQLQQQQMMLQLMGTVIQNAATRRR